MPTLITLRANVPLESFSTNERVPTLWTADVGTATTLETAPVRDDHVGGGAGEQPGSGRGERDHDRVGVARCPRLDRAHLGHRAVEGAAGPVDLHVRPVTHRDRGHLGARQRPGHLVGVGPDDDDHIRARVGADGGSHVMPTETTVPLIGLVRFASFSDCWARQRGLGRVDIGLVGGDLLGSVGRRPPIRGSPVPRRRCPPCRSGSRGPEDPDRRRRGPDGRWEGRCRCRCRCRCRAPAPVPVPEPEPAPEPEPVPGGARRPLTAGPGTGPPRPWPRPLVRRHLLLVLGDLSEGGSRAGSWCWSMVGRVGVVVRAPHAFWAWAKSAASCCWSVVALASSLVSVAWSCGDVLCEPAKNRPTPRRGSRAGGGRGRARRGR